MQVMGVAADNFRCPALCALGPPRIRLQLGQTIPLLTASFLSGYHISGFLPDEAWGACRTAQKYRGVNVSSNGDERPLNSCPSLLFFWRMIWITFYLVSQGPQSDWASVAHRVNQVSNTLFVTFPPLWSHSPCSPTPDSQDHLPDKLPEPMSKPQPCFHLIQKPLKTFWQMKQEEKKVVGSCQAMSVP